MGDWSLRGGSRSQNFGSVSSSASTGTQITANASGNTKGSYTQLIASTAFDASWLYVAIGTEHELRSLLLDIAVGAGGSEQIIIPNLRGSPRFTQNYPYLFPVRIPAGSRIAARCQASTGSSTCRVAGVLYGGGFSDQDVLPRISDYGTDTSTSKGTNVDAGTSGNTKGSYAQLVSSCNEVRQLVIAATPGTVQDYGGGGNEMLVDIAIGAAASEQIIAPDLYFALNTVTDLYMPPVLVVPCRIPSGTRIAARAQSNTTTSPNRIVNLIAYGVGG